jgi:hypothetical protein
LAEFECGKTRIQFFFEISPFYRNLLIPNRQKKKPETNVEPALTNSLQTKS